MIHEGKKTRRRRTGLLMFYDALLLLLVDVVFLVVGPSTFVPMSTLGVIENMLLSGLCIFGARIFGGVYRQVWRYESDRSYILLMSLDFIAGVAYWVLSALLPIPNLAFVRAVSMVSVNLLMTIGIRMIYQYMYDYQSRYSRIINLLRPLSRVLTGAYIDADMIRTESQREYMDRRINIAIVGAGRVGVMLADELVSNPRSYYQPRCFIDIDQEKIGRSINGIPVISENEANESTFSRLQIQEIVLALPDSADNRRTELYKTYKSTGRKIKVYDYPTTQSADGARRQMREFDIEELLFRAPRNFLEQATVDYYRGKRVLITGGGGSIGGEIARQIARMKPEKLILVDVYENGIYDVQQELRMAYGSTLQLQVVILSICDRQLLDQVFSTVRPQVVIHAAAHKHVPLMQDSVCECVKNNVFGTLNVVDMCETYGVEKAIMVSTDKAVNPTNVMGATKRMCEMIFQSRVDSRTVFTCTRFGNVLGSNGSVIPLFKRQIANGGPVTLTDKRIIRYFMTIPEASQLVLTSGSMARQGELYVLNMGEPVHILELAENMIRLSGFEPYSDIPIVETGLRPGEKLYEELLIKTEELDRTDNSMIFIERDVPLSREEIERKLDILRQAVSKNDNAACKAALKQVVPTYISPKDVNKTANESEEMKQAK